MHLPPPSYACPPHKFPFLYCAVQLERWGRIAETYGEDPYLISRIGTTATRSLQQAVPTADGTDVHLASAQTTRHYMGFHGSNQMPDLQNCTAQEDGYPVWQCGTHMMLSPRDLVDQYLPAYE